MSSRERRIRDRRKLVKLMRKWLCKEFPLDRPVSVVFREILVGAHGVAVSNARRHMIVIDDGLSVDAIEGVLLHEWAHCLAPHERGCGHTVAWGRVMARIYKRFTECTES